MTCEFVGCGREAVVTKITTWNRPDGTPEEQITPLCKRDKPRTIPRKPIFGSFRGINFRAVYQYVKGLEGR
jgi:hypothetical protein